MFGRKKLPDMLNDKPSRLQRKNSVLAVFAAVSLAFLTNTVVCADEFGSTMAPLQMVQVAAVEQRMNALQTRITELNAGLLGLAPQTSAVVGTGDTRVHVAQSARDIGTMNVRLGQLEEQMRVLTGQVEGLQFQMTQLQTLLERMQEDNEYRFQALEGGGLGKTDAAPRTEGAMPLDGVPQTDAGPQPLDLTAPIDLGGVDTVIDPGPDPDLANGEAVPELGPIPLGTLSLPSQLPLDDIPANSGLVSDADADAQYRAGYDAVVRGDYAFAEDQFRQFIALFPDHPSAPDATNWLGEALLQRGDFEEAANILLTGFQSYPNSQRAPDLLLKLGMALAGSGERDTACRTFSEILRRYPTVSTVFKARLNEEIAKAQC